MQLLGNEKTLQETCRVWGRWKQSRMEDKKNAAPEGQVQELREKVKSLERSLVWICVSLIVIAVVVGFCFWCIGIIIDAIVSFQNSVISFNERILSINEQVFVFIDVLNDFLPRINELLEQLKLF